MNREHEGTLAALLHGALKSVTITQSRAGGLHPRDYRRMVQRYRAVYDPTLRLHTFTFDIEIEDAKVKQPILNLLRTELAKFLREDRVYAATYAIHGGLGSGSSTEDILKSLLKAAIVNGPQAAAKAFYDESASGYLPYREYFLLSGIKVEKEVQVCDGISLVPLPNSTQHLPGFLSDLFRVDSSDFLSKTLLTVDMSVSPLLHRPEQDYTIQSGPDRHFNIAVRSADHPDFDLGKFFLALTLVGENPVFTAIRWTYLSDDSIFDLRISPGSGYSHDTRRASTTVFSEAQVREAVNLFGKITALPQGVYKRLQIPIDRWVKSKTHQGYVDRMIDLGIALESFYLCGIRDELSFRLRLRAALYLGDGIQQRTQLKKEVRQIYDIRSEAVHEGTVPEQVRVEGQTVRMSEFLERSQELFKRSLLKVIENGRLPDWDSIELGGEEETGDNTGEPDESQAVGSDRD